MGVQLCPLTSFGPSSPTETRNPRELLGSEGQGLTLAIAKTSKRNCLLQRGVVEMPLHRVHTIVEEQVCGVILGDVYRLIDLGRKHDLSRVSRRELLSRASPVYERHGARGLFYLATRHTNNRWIAPWSVQLYPPWVVPVKAAGKGLNLLGGLKEAYLTFLKQTCLRRGVEASYADPV